MSPETDRDDRSRRLQADIDGALAKVRRPLFSTRTGMFAERLFRAFWPCWSVLLLTAASILLGVHDMLAGPAWQSVATGFVVALLATAAWGIWRFKWPRRDEALDRLDRTLPGRPIATLGDNQAIGAGDTASEQVWRAHLSRMAIRVRQARAVPPDLKVAPWDRFGLRLMALTVFVVALLFGSVWRVTTVGTAGSGGASALASGPSWEGWVEPPIYTGRPSLYLNDISAEQLELSHGARITVRLYGEVGSLSVAESVSGAEGQGGDAAGPVQEFVVSKSGRIAIEGPGGRGWDILLRPDDAPTITLDGPVDRAVDGEMRQGFAAVDDYGVVTGRAEIRLDVAAVDRRYGLAADPEEREAVVLDLPLPFTGDRTDFAETLTENLSEHPWATLPVTLSLFASDAMGQEGTTGPQSIVLPGRRFFDPLAKAVIEQRRDLLWSRGNGARTARVLRAVTHLPEGFVRNEAAYLKLRVAIRELEAAVSDGLTEEARDATAAILWDIAMELEYGNLNDARERLDRAQDRLAEAIENGASDEEIAELMQELREAMQEYMRQLAEQQGQQNQQQAQNQGEMQEITGDQLQDMLDRLQELMEQGRMAEAQQLLDQLRQMMENMQIAQGQQGQGQQSEGQQAMRGLQETLRDQQGLSDEAFRDLQEQFNPGAEAGESGQNQGRNGGQGQGEQHEGQQGQGQAQGNQPGGGGQQNADPNGQGGQPDAQTLAQRQRALRDRLEQQRRNLPGAGTPEGDAARESLGDAGEAMDRAEEQLGQDDLAGALDSQSEAMEALREGMRNLGEALAQEQQQQGGQGQEQAGRSNPLGQRDPLGRDVGANGRLGTDEEFLRGEDVYRRAQELMDEILRRSGEQSRPDVELDYLRRLLDRF
ncbi:MAG: TIGR02302 family protein [Pseudomonadota bacterium]